MIEPCDKYVACGSGPEGCCIKALYTDYWFPPRKPVRMDKRVLRMQGGDGKRLRLTTKPNGETK